MAGPEVGGLDRNMPEPFYRRSRRNAVVPYSCASSFTSYFFWPHLCICTQTGPGGVGNNTTNVLWLSADNGVNLNGRIGHFRNDRSGGINNATSPSVLARPTPTDQR